MSLAFGGIDRTLAIVGTANNRPEYLTEVLDSWHVAETIPQQWWLEPGEHAEEVACMIEAAGHRAHHNAEKLGPLVNPFQAIEAAFADPAVERVILAEDDSIVSPDILAYFAAADHFRATCPYPETLPAACAYQTRYPPAGDTQLASSIVLEPRFSPTVWMTWRSVWESWMRDTWDLDYSTGNPDGSEAGWDWHINRLMRRWGLHALFPIRARSLHIGQFGGAHTVPEEFEAPRSKNFLAAHYFGTYELHIADDVMQKLALASPDRN